ncbi:PAS domain-containing protein [Kiloniella sp.]|uniref:PAS domain-containing protein n=1 Tax=Kiloniella sp. TaxID=1938587 RepID=UPI003B0243D7
MDVLSSATNKSLLAYWLKLSEGAGVPQRARFDPINIDPEVLPHIFLCSLGYAPFSVHFRLQGTFITEYLGQAYTGKELNKETFGESADEVKALYKRVADTRHPVVSQELISAANGDEILIEVLHMPLMNKQGKVAFVLGSIDAMGDDYLNKQHFVSHHWVVKSSTGVSVDP